MAGDRAEMRMAPQGITTRAKSPVLFSAMGLPLATAKTSVCGAQLFRFTYIQSRHALPCRPSKRCRAREGSSPAFDFLRYSLHVSTEKS